MAVYTVNITDGGTFASLDVGLGRGPKGDGFTGGSFNAATGQIIFTSDDGIGFTTDDVRVDLGAPGPIGDVTPDTGDFTNITVTGTVTADGLTVENDGGTKQVVIANGTPGTQASPEFADVLFTGASGRDKVRIRGVDENSNVVGGRLLLETSDANSTDQASLKTRVNIASNGDISFYEDTGTTPKFFWDASAESLGIGTSSPAAPLHVDALSAGASAAALHLRNGSDTAGTDVRAYFTPNSSTALNRSAYVGAVSTTAGNDSSLVFGTNANGASPAERMRIDSSGNVGIGTSSPLTFANYSVLTINDSNGGALALSSGGTVAGTIASFSNDIYHDTIDATIFRSGALFTGSPTERMRIDSSGNLLVGTTSPYGVSKTTIDYSSNGAFGITLRDTGSATDGAMAYFVKGGAVVGSIVSNTSSTSYNTSSDYRLKEDVQPMTGASDRVLALNPVNFAWKADGTRVDGFLAHEAQEVVPAAVTGEKDGEEMQAIDQSKLVPLLTAALQEALQKIDALEARITALEA